MRVISPDKLRAVSPSAKVKDRFIVVDAVGVCEQDKTDSRTLNRQPAKTLEQVLNYIAQGGLDPEALTTLAGRLARLQRDFAPDQLDELRVLAGGKSLPALARDLLNACDRDVQVEAAKGQAESEVPTEGEIGRAATQLAREAVTPFLKAAFRRRILEMRQQNEQTIDRHTIDEVLHSGFDAAAVDKARARVRDFRSWIEQHRDELTALQVIYAGVRPPLKLSLGDLRQLRDELARPPLRNHPGPALACLPGGGAGQGQGRTRSVGRWRGSRLPIS